MSNDLINRSKVISILEQLEEHSLTGKVDISNVIYLLKNQQTAYDFDFQIEKYLHEYMEKEKKYRWHDLIKDPDDLPDDLHKVLIHIKGYEDYRGVDMAMHHKFTGIWSTIFASYKDEEVIAWREIEPFEEE